MKKRILVIFVITALALLISACSCDHQWANATCDLPKTCKNCGETEGTSLGHKWERATCMQAAFCPQCGSTNGEPAGHTWKDADCITAKTCSVCKESEGEPLGHIWKEATCTTVKTCSVCQATDGEPLPHTVTEWSQITAPSCTEAGLQEGSCNTCGNTVSETLDPLPHTESDWEITLEATRTEKGTRTKHCTVCEKELATESYELSKEEKDKLFKSECKTYSYNDIARNPSKYENELVKFTGTVIQSMEKSGSYILRVKLKNYKEVIYVQYVPLDSNEGRILEDDRITMYGIFAGTVTYETVMGASVTIPAMIATHIDFA